MQMLAIDAAHKDALFGTVTGIGALAAVIVNPVAGLLSDRTSGRFGRRHPWTLGGAVLGVAALAALSGQHTVAGVAICWVLAQSGLNAMLASLTAGVPDRVPVPQRALVSGWVGMCQVAGLVIGSILVIALGLTWQTGYLVIAVLVLPMTLPFVLRSHDDRLPRENRPPAHLVAGWIAAFRDADFSWAWGTRFLVQLGNALGTLYLLYFLRDKVHYAKPDEGLLFLILIYAGALFIAAIISGWLSDRAGKRKRYVIASGVVMSVGAAILAVLSTFPAAMAAAVFMGAGYGIYVAVDVALVTEVLPSAAARGKDLGVINIANSAPQVLAPFVAAPIVTSLGGYPMLYLLTAVSSLLGGVLVRQIKSVA
jgi:MFS family permease